MVTVNIDGKEAKVSNGEWTSEDADLANLLNNWTKNERATATPNSEFYMLDSPSNPYPDLALAEEAVAEWGGEITDEGRAPEDNPDVIH
ncbi:hypothetical protein NDI47_25585 [Microcoleus vaginatus GB1-A2]|uniref:hypothetical protein n=1 Tax=Microcoleus vaginatus TaxID=119532 RepID=UPI0016830781|nr:hypothetical protein [Microcoleus sp. FACHB-61]